LDSLDSERRRRSDVGQGTKARQESRQLVFKAGLSDQDIDRPIKQVQKEADPGLPA
jgi:hypothetical protein